MEYHIKQYVDQLGLDIKVGTNGNMHEQQLDVTIRPSYDVDTDIFNLAKNDYEKIKRTFELEVKTIYSDYILLYDPSIACNHIAREAAIRLLTPVLDELSQRILSTMQKCYSDREAK